MKITQNWIDPNTHKKCALLRVNSHWGKDTQIENIINHQNIDIKLTEKTEADPYSNSPYAEGMYKLCQIVPEMDSFVTVKITEKHKKRSNSKTSIVNEKLETINLFGKDFEKEVTERKKKFGDNVIGLDEL